MKRLKKICDETKFESLSFNQALSLLEDGYKLKRKCWTDSYIVMRSSNLLSINDGARLRTIIYIKEAHEFWRPGQQDIVATDWEVVE